MGPEIARKNTLVGKCGIRNPILIIAMGKARMMTGYAGKKEACPLPRSLCAMS